MGLDLPYFLKNGFWVTIRQVTTVVMGLLLSTVFARLASKEIFGQYQFVLSILSVVSILSVPGFNTSITRAVARGYDGDYRKVVQVSFFWSLIGVPTLLAIGGYYYAIGNHSLGIALMVAAIFFPFIYAPNTWDSFLQGKSRFDVSAKYSSIQVIINTIATIMVLLFSRDSLVAIVTWYLLSYTFFNGYYYWRSLRYVENEKMDEGTVKYGWFLTKINILGMISGNLDKLLVGLFMGPPSLAVYSIGILFTKQIQNLSKGFLWMSVPKQIRQGNISRENYVRIFSVSMFLTVVFIISFQFVIPLLFTDKYAESISLAILSILFYPVFVISVLYRNQSIFNKKESILLKESIITPVIMVALTILLLPRFGSYGLAFLFGFQSFVGLLVLYVLNKPTISFVFLRKR